MSNLPFGGRLILKAGWRGLVDLERIVVQSLKRLTGAHECCYCSTKRGRSAVGEPCNTIEANHAADNATCLVDAARSVSTCHLKPPIHYRAPQLEAALHRDLAPTPPKRL